MLGAVKAFFKKAVTENLRLKALALVITFVVFALVRGGREATARITIDVEVLRPPESSNRILVAEVPETLKLRVRGSQRLVELVSDEEVPPVTLDLREEHDGVYRLDKARFRVPPGLSIVSITPPSIHLRYERRITKDVEVMAVLVGRVAEGHHVVDPVTAEPSRVTLSGPVGGIARMTEVQTEPLFIGGLGRGTHELNVRVQPPPEHARYLGSEEVSVRVMVEPDALEHRFDNVTVAVRGTSLPATAERVTVVLRGRPDVVAAATPESLAPFVELLPAEGGPGTYRKEVRLQAAVEGVEASIIPPTVIVQVGALPEPADRGEANAPEPGTAGQRDGAGDAGAPGRMKARATQP